METHYTDNPHNFQEISSYVITDKTHIVREVLTARKCYFYDTCSFRKHAKLRNPQYIFDFIKRCQGIIMITRCILMELASHSGILESAYIEYIVQMHRAELRVVVLYEEDIFDVLDVCFSSRASVNRVLSWAVKAVKRPTGTVEATLKSDRGLQKDVLDGNVTHSTLFKRFFSTVRSNKEPGDNLGEELVVICFHILSNLPGSRAYKYVLLTEDKGAVGMIHKAADNILLHHRIQAFSALTSARLAQRMYEEGVITQKAQVEEILAAGVVGGIVRILGSEEYDLNPVEKTMTCGELAEKIVRAHVIHINY